MVDIAKYPYYSYNQAVEPLFESIKSQANIQFLNFHRKYPNRERFCIVLHKEHSVDWHASEFYKHSPFEKKSIEDESAFHMWDHQSPNLSALQNREHIRRRHDIDHGLTIVLKNETYCDYFVFASNPGNDQINNFYLNKKELFEDFTHRFYTKMAPTIDELSHHRFIIPSNIVDCKNQVLTLSPRQQDCALLMASGLTAKEIAKNLALSPRTVEEYINVMKKKFDAKNRIHLMGMLQKNL